MLPACPPFSLLRDNVPQHLVEEHEIAMTKINSTLNAVSFLDVFAFSYFLFWLRIVAWILLLRPLEILLGWCGYHPFEVDLYRYTIVAKGFFSKYTAALVVDPQQLKTHQTQLNDTMKMFEELRQTEITMATMYAFAYCAPVLRRLPAACRAAAYDTLCYCGRLHARLQPAAGTVIVEHIAGQHNTTPSTLQPCTCVRICVIQSGAARDRDRPYRMHAVNLLCRACVVCGVPPFLHAQRQDCRDIQEPHQTTPRARCHSLQQSSCPCH